MVIDFKSAGEPGTWAEFSYHITPSTISITGKGRLSVSKDLEVLRKIEYWHQASVTKFRIIARQGQGTWHGVRWDGKGATAFVLNETDENKAMQALLLKHPIEETGSLSDREIDANQKPLMSDHDKNLFIEQHKDGYAILRGGVKEPLAVEPTQDAAIEKARKLDPDAAIDVERVRNVEGGGRDKWRRVDRRQAAPRFLGFFCARLSCRAATMSITLLRAGFGGGAWRFWPLALSSISFFTSSV